VISFYSFHFKQHLCSVVIINRLALLITAMDANTSGAELGCQACLANFERREIKRAHMKEDWQ
jgi:hypothetical protein